MNPPKTDALCCECGQLRRVSDHYARIDDNWRRDGREEADFWRMTMTLKCSHCARCTRHALLRLGKFRDSLEEREKARLEGREYAPGRAWEIW